MPDLSGAYTKNEVSHIQVGDQEFGCTPNDLMKAMEVSASTGDIIKIRGLETTVLCQVENGELIFFDLNISK